MWFSKSNLPLMTFSTFFLLSTNLMFIHPFLLPCSTSLQSSAPLEPSVSATALHFAWPIYPCITMHHLDAINLLGFNGRSFLRFDLPLFGLSLCLSRLNSREELGSQRNHWSGQQIALRHGILYLSLHWWHCMRRVSSTAISPIIALFDRPSFDLSAIQVTLPRPDSPNLSIPLSLYGVDVKAPWT